MRLAAVMDPQARESDGVIDYVTEVHHSPNRDEIVQVLVAEEKVTRAELAAEFDRRRAQQAEQRAGRCGETPPAGKAGASAALVAELLALAEQSARLVKRFARLVQLDVTQQADARVALDALDVFMTWARQVTAISGAGVPAQRRAQRRARRETATA